MTKVGVRDVLKPVVVDRRGRRVTLTARIDVFVDLPADQKGSHLSRNVEAIGEILDASVRSPVPSLEDLAARIATKLLAKHAYASTSDVWISADYFLERTAPWGRKSLEPYRLVARAEASRAPAIRVRRSIGVEVIGMTACPCAMETLRDEMSNRGAGLPGLPEGFPTITHNQRNHTTVILEEPEGFDVEADDLIGIVEGSMSSPTYEILKRPDEGKLVEQAHRNPKFVEDVVREVLARLLEAFGDLPDGVHVRVKSESEESIHKHNAFAERDTTLGELRA